MKKKWRFEVCKGTMSDGKACWLANAMKMCDDWYGCGLALPSEEAARGYLYAIQSEHNIQNNEIEWIGLRPWGELRQMDMFEVAK